MNIYFSCAITGGRNDQATYEALVIALLNDGHVIPTANLSSANVMEEEAVISPHAVYDRDVNWIKGCDVVVAEVSTPSHGVGYEVALAEAIGKPVLCCHAQGRRVSKMITGNPNPKVRVIPYRNDDELIAAVREYLRQLQGTMPADH
jgi:nucleoside 2-deoxyribosyltransferase